MQSQNTNWSSTGDDECERTKAARIIWQRWGAGAGFNIPGNETQAKSIGAIMLAGTKQQIQTTNITHKRTQTTK